MNDYIIMDGLSRRFTDTEIADIETLFGSDPAIAILVDGTNKDRRRADRRKKTVAKHNHQKAIVDSVYPIKDSYVKKNPKKAIRDAKEYYIWDYYSDEPIRKKVAKKFDLRQAKIEVSYEERRSQFFKAVDQWRHDDALRVLAERMIESLDAQEDPDNRIIVESWLDDGIIYIRSNCDGWAEDVKPFILLEHGDTVTPADLVGLTESQAKHLYEMDQCGFHIDLIDDEFIF